MCSPISEVILLYFFTASRNPVARCTQSCVCSSVSVYVLFLWGCKFHVSVVCEVWRCHATVAFWRARFFLRDLKFSNLSAAVADSGSCQSELCTAKAENPRAAKSHARTSVTFITRQVKQLTSRDEWVLCARSKYSAFTCVAVALFGAGNSVLFVSLCDVQVCVCSESCSLRGTAGM